MRTGVLSFAILGLSVLFLQLLLFLLLGLKDVMLHLDTFHFGVLLRNLIVGEFSPYLDKLLVFAGLMT